MSKQFIINRYPEKEENHELRRIENDRRFVTSIIAHIDHGKSTLADHAFGKTETVSSRNGTQLWIAWI